MVPVRDGIKLETVIFTPTNARRPAADPVSPHAVRRAGERGERRPGLAQASWRATATSSSSRTCAAGSDPKAPSSCRRRPTSRTRRPPARRRTPTTSIDWLVQERAEQQRQGRDVRRLLRRSDLGDDAAAAASGAGRDLGTGVARRSVDERRRPSLRRAARELRVRIRRATSRRTRTRTRTSTSRPTTPTPGTSTSVRCRTSTPSTCTGRFRTGTRSSSTPTTTSSGRRKRG